MKKNQLFQILSNNILFKDVPDAEMNCLDDNNFILLHYNPGDIVIKKDDPSNEIFLIVSGVLQITNNLANGQNVEIVTRKHGDIIGEVGLIEDKPRSTNVICQTEVDLIRIEKENFFSIINMLSSIKFNIIRVLNTRFRESIFKTSSEINKNQRMLDLNKKIVSQKIELERLNKELRQKNEELYLMAMTDELTKINNRTFMMEILKKTFSNSIRYQMVFSCILVDIDHFKAFNDNHGHLVGDFVLIKTAQLLKTLIRKGDYVARFGGEEFLIILPNTHINDAKIVADKINKTIAQTEYIFENKTNLNITVSMGLTDNQSNNYNDEYQMLKDADLALYEAKRKGRNQSILFSSNC